MEDTHRLVLHVSVVPVKSESVLDVLALLAWEKARSRNISGPFLGHGRLIFRLFVVIVLETEI